MVPLEFRVEVMDNLQEIKIPIFGPELAPDRCSTYARLAAELIFGAQYPEVSTKKIRFAHEIGTIPASNSQLPELVRHGIVTPGMLLGVYSPRNRYNDSINPYAHLSLFLGQQARTPLFLEQLGRRIRTANLGDYDLEGCEIKEALFLKKLS
mgnify:FL=1